MIDDDFGPTTFLLPTQGDLIEDILIWDIAPVISMIACARMLLNIRDVMTLSDENKTFSTNDQTDSASSDDFISTPGSYLPQSRKRGEESWEVGMTPGDLSIPEPVRNRRNPSGIMDPMESYYRHMDGGEIEMVQRKIV